MMNYKMVDLFLCGTLGPHAAVQTPARDSQLS